LSAGTQGLILIDPKVYGLYGGSRVAPRGGERRKKVHAIDAACSKMRLPGK
jgi:hypothetical protein